jgi:hypothetical protein
MIATSAPLAASIELSQPRLSQGETMRTFVLLLAFAIPPLIACSGAYARTATDIGKPVCMRFDDAAKPASVVHATAVPAAPAAKAASLEPAVHAPVANAMATQNKGGGASDAMRPRAAPRWQTFLPGMFR